MTKEQEYVDWFAIDMEAFTRLYNEYVQAEKDAKEAQRLAELCERRECGHGPFKKDGTPHRGRPCEDDKGYLAMRDAGNLANALYYTHHKDFWKAIGLGVDA